MGKFTSIFLVVYLLYYAGNIIYDLFLRKDNKLIDDDIEDEFSIDGNAEEDKMNVKSVGIDDVENVVRPVIENNTVEEESHSEKEVEPDIDNMRRKFEDEKEIETFNEPNKKVQSKKSFKEKNKERFKEMMKMAETNVQLVDSYEGQKVYQSIMKFTN